jgi:hypothetical protein
MYVFRYSMFESRLFERSTKSYYDARKNYESLWSFFLAKSTYRTLKEFNFTRLHR